VDIDRDIDCCWSVLVLSESVSYVGVMDTVSISLDNGFCPVAECNECYKGLK